MSIESPDTPETNDYESTSPAFKDQSLQGLASKSKQDLDAAAQRASEDVRELGHQASAKVGEAAEKAKSFVVDQKGFAAGQINGVAAAVLKVADELDSSDQQTIARYARDLASGLSSMGKTIEDRDVDDLLGMTQDFGRKQPVAFLGAAALAGFVASRFALASAHRRENKPTSSDVSTSDQSIGDSTFANRMGGQYGR
jgi:hypothetical protein